MKRATKPVSTAEILRVLREVERVLMLSDPEGKRAAFIHAPEDPQILSLCWRIGFGAVMDSAARQYRKEVGIGALTTGAAVGTVQDALKMVVRLIGRLSAERAEIRGLKARLKVVNKCLDWAMWPDGVPAKLEAAFDLKNKNWRKP